MKYYIIPLTEVTAEVEAESKSDALIDFATKMESDMSMYFKAVTEEELGRLRYEERSEAVKTHIIEFMESELINGFDVPEDIVSDIAREGYEIYSRGDGHTQYEALEEAYDNWRAEIKKELESKLGDYDLEGCEISDEDIDVFIENLRAGNTREETTELILNDIRETLDKGLEDDADEVKALNIPGSEQPKFSWFNEKIRERIGTESAEIAARACEIYKGDGIDEFKALEMALEKAGANKENPVKNNNDRMFEELKAQLFLKGTDAIEDFLGVFIPIDEDKDVIENRLNDAYQQMPDDIFTRYCAEYGIAPRTSSKDELVIKDYFDNELKFKLNGKWFHDECRRIAEEDAEIGSIDDDEIETYADNLYENTSDKTKEDVLKAALKDVEVSGLECDDDEIQTTLDALGEIQKYIKNNRFEKEIVVTINVYKLNDVEGFNIYIDGDLNSCGINASETEDIIMAYIAGRKKSA